MKLMVPGNKPTAYFISSLGLSFEVLLSIIKNHLTLFYCQIPSSLILVKIELWVAKNGGSGIFILLEIGKSENRKSRKMFF